MFLRKVRANLENKGILRSTILIDQSFRIAEVWRNVPVRRKTESCEILHAQKVLEKLRELKSAERLK